MKRTKSWDKAPQYKSGSVRAGVLETAVYPDGTPVAQVGFWNEYGTARAPSRSFMRATINQDLTGWLELIGKNIALYDTDKALGIIGAEMAGAFTQAVMEFSDPPNAPYTIAKKGFNKPLIDTSVLSRSISWEVDK